MSFLTSVLSYPEYATMGTHHSFKWCLLGVGLFLVTSSTAQGLHHYYTSFPTGGLGIHRDIWDPFFYHSMSFRDDPFQSMARRSLLSPRVGLGFGPSLRVWEPRNKLKDENGCYERNDITFISQETRNHQNGQEKFRNLQDSNCRTQPVKGASVNQEYSNVRHHREARKGTTSSQQHDNLSPTRPVRGTTSYSQKNNRQSEPVEGATSTQQHDNRRMENRRTENKRTTFNQQQNNPQSESRQSTSHSRSINKGHPHRGHPLTAPLKEISRLDIKGYHPGDIKIKVQDDVITVTGMQSCRCEENCLEKEFERKIPLSNQVDPRTVSATVSPGDQNVLLLKGSQRLKENGIPLPASGLDVPVEGNFKPITRDSDPSCGSTKRGIKLKKMDARSKQIVDDIEEVTIEEKFEGEVDEDGVTIEIA